jgi:hypothetical protein
MFGGLATSPIIAEAQRGSSYRSQRNNSAQLDRLIDRVEQSSNSFREAFERALRDGELPGAERRDDIRRRVQRLDERLEDLRSEFDRDDRRREARTAVTAVLNEARPINNIMSQRRRISPAVMSRWVRLRADLNALAREYRMARL